MSIKKQSTTKNKTGLKLARATSKKVAPWIHKPSAAEVRAVKELADTTEKLETQKVVDTTPASEVSSVQQNKNEMETTTETATNSQPEVPAKTEKKTMTLTFKNISKNGRNAFYTGTATPIRIPLSAFPGKQAPPSFEVSDGVFAPAKEAKVKMTAEERKAANAAKPKPTLAERIAKREQNLARDKAKLAAQGASQEATL